MKLLTLAIVLSAVMIAGAIFMSNRYALEQANIDEPEFPDEAAIWRIDQITGQVCLCSTVVKLPTCECEVR